MSTSERDELDILVNGEWANEAMLDFLDSTASALVKNELGVVVRECGYLHDNGSILMIVDSIDEEEEAEGSVVRLTLGKFADADPKYCLVFSYENELCDLSFAEEADLRDAWFIAEDLLDDEVVLDKDGRAIARYVQRLVEFSMGRIPEGMLGWEGAEHVADIARRIVANRSTCATREAEYGKAFDDDRAIRIISHEVIGTVADETDIEQLPLLQVIYEDRKTGLDYYYAKTRGGERSLVVYNASEPEIPEEAYFDNEEIEKLLNAVEDETPSMHDVKVLINELLEAKALEEAETSSD